MANESPQQRRSRQLREDRDRCREAAQRFRHRIAQGRYRSLPDSDGDDLLYLAAVLDSAGTSLSELPDQMYRDVLHAVRRLLDDGPKRGDVDPITRGDGH
ncbi:hypothetical protein EV383_4348 [Pseudonocardia sediminis]|uniref:Uncharacterized protein n=1 Tax=Pseudonocardia sediminis TaxID=1397368 RepID=A0A4Q7V027_PSEST|nr:hypothetical protein [Pseudonocardia sediminis]RZT87425.1 hypothetical protein EV383_4348 [Pseudonocardia sediminis]